MSEQAGPCFNRSDRKWIMCPTCRQRTDFNDIAYVAEKPIVGSDSDKAGSHQADMDQENSVGVRGSYGTKVLFLFIWSHILLLLGFAMIMGI